MARRKKKGTRRKENERPRVEAVEIPKHIPTGQQPHCAVCDVDECPRYNEAATSCWYKDHNKLMVPRRGTSAAALETIIEANTSTLFGAFEQEDAEGGVPTMKVTKMSDRYLKQLDRLWKLKLKGD